MNPRPNNPKINHRPDGFTLVEMLTVVIVMAIAAALAIPMFSSTAITKLQGAASMLAADLSFAQVESLAHSEDPRVVVFDNPNDTYHLAAASDTTTPITHPLTKQPYLIDYDPAAAGSLTGVTISAYDLNGDDQLAFGTYGQLDQPTPATITLQCDTLTVTITTDPNTGESTIGAIN